MVLVNAGTNMHVPSGRITAIDPRGGAAVLGDNGVGKTTTLRILPLFFGHQPSQILSAGQGQEAMVRFILPTDASAIVFEYQRGSGKEEDHRLVVIRRRGDEPDVPFYRLYRCGFRKELFVSEGRFLDDEGTQHEASKLDIQTTSKLTTSEYRSVILRTPATSKEKERLRRYALEWSFGPKPLDNLDRLVAAMVKKHINFADIVQVAVGLVQQDLGLGAERAKLTFKQGKGQIELWLKTRQACLDAFKLQPKVSELEETIQAFHASEARFRARRADVIALRNAREGERSELAKAMEAMVVARNQVVTNQGTEQKVLSEATTAAASKAAQARQAYEDHATQAQYFENNGASVWEQKVLQLLALRLDKQGLQSQIDAAQAVHSEATAKYEKLKNEASLASSSLQLELEQGKKPHQDRYQKALERIGETEEQAKAEAAGQHEARREELERRLEPLLESQGDWKSRAQSPAASQEAIGAVETALERLQQHTSQCAEAAQEAAAAAAHEGDARRAFAAHEEGIREAKKQLETAEAGLVAARLLLAPNPGSLLAALRSHVDASWKRNLAKVVRPELLERDDLEPTLVEELGQSLYGWRLNMGVIEAPEWTDDELARKAVEAAEFRQAAALSHVQAEQGELPAKARVLKEAEQAKREKQARRSVLDGQTEELKIAVATARQRVDSEKNSSAATASRELARLGAAIEALRAQSRSSEGVRRQEVASITLAHSQQRAAAKLLLDHTLAAIDANIGRVGVELEEKLKAIDAQLKEHLASQGVDVEKLETLRGQLKEVSAEVRKLEEHQPLVERWRAWVDDGGPAKVASLRASAEQARVAAEEHASRLTLFEQRIRQERDEYEAASAVKEKRAADVDDELAILGEVELEFGDYMASGQAAIDLSTTAKDLRGRVRADRASLKEAEGGVHRRYTYLRQQLTGRDNAVQELVEGSLAQVKDDDIVRAAELCTCFKLIGPQVANNVNLTLRTLLANIGAFQKSIQSFEREVSAFNRRLQAGLSEVRRFERIKDLRLDIITNFENLGFYKKLSRMDNVLRAHANEYGKDYTRELPPDETARALGDFMSVLSSDGAVEVNLSSHITLRGSVTDNGVQKEFKRASELENISSEGLTSLVLITLLTALLNTIRGSEPVHVPWVTDEVGKFDPTNFTALMRMLQENRIDVVTASPELGAVQQAMFARRYLFQDRGRIQEYGPRVAAPGKSWVAVPVTGEVAS